MACGCARPALTCLETIDGYVGRLKRALRGSITTRRRVAEEVRLHLEELAASETDAVDRVDAERRATQRMGSPERLAAEMPYRRWNPWIVIVATVVCAVAGFAYSTQETAIYASTSSVLYIPSSGTASSGPSNNQAASDWGNIYAPLAESTEFGARVLQSLPVPIAGLTARQLQKDTTVAVIPSGNGLNFALNNATSLNAIILADAYSAQFPIYLAAHTANPELARAIQQNLDNVRFKLANAPRTIATVQTHR